MVRDNLPKDGDTDGTLDKILDILDVEGQQEESAFADENSILLGKDSDLIRKRAQEYRDTQKHWVRRNIWLESVKSIAQKKREKTIRYLTLPALHRLDVC